MTPVDEMEQLIKEIVIIHDDIDQRYSYSLKSFPEICLLKGVFYYTVGITKDYYKNDDVIKRYEELRDELRTRKITFENQIVSTDRKILFHYNYSKNVVPIYYKNCVFIYPYIFNGDNCENCIVEWDET